MIILTFSQFKEMIDLDGKKSPKVYNITVFTKVLMFVKPDDLILSLNKFNVTCTSSVETE